MIFTTPEFVAFALVFAVAFAALSGTPRRVLLLLASYTFYGAWDVRFLALLAGSTLLDFTVARAVHRTGEGVRRRRFLLVSLVGNLGVLALLKYYGFFVESARALLSALGTSVSPPVLELVLPVGISFYTFQTLGYTIDVYRRRQVPTDSLLDFANYVAFFPQLVAGPIERASRLLPQMTRIGERGHGQSSGWGFIAVGVFKKVVIADNLGAFVDVAYADPGATYSPMLLLATYAFAAQIYCDFSGYSDIAVGLGRLMGVELMQNFRAPYAAASPQELWRRWHISLSTWLRDYLYIPLGGNRGGRLAVQRNLVLTMLLGGLWHGAAWHFVLWGAFHGGLLALGRARPLSAAAARLPLFLRRLLMFQLVCVGWVLFRAASVADARTVLVRIFDPARWELAPWLEAVSESDASGYLRLITALCFVVVAWQMATAVDTHAVVRRLWRAPWVVRLYFVVGLLYAAVVLVPEQPPPFIYFQF